MKNIKNSEQNKGCKTKKYKKTIMGLSISFLGLQNINLLCLCSLQQTLQTSSIPTIGITKNNQNESITTINIVAHTLGKASNIFNLLYNGEKVTNFKDVKCEYIGDPELANKIILDTDFSIKWKDTIEVGKYNAKWRITYKDKKIETPQIVLNCLSKTDYEQGKIPSEYEINPKQQEEQLPSETTKVYDISSRGAKFKYSDSFFTKLSSQYNPSLAVASYGLINCAGNYESVRIEDSDKWIKDLMLNQFKFQNYEQIGYRKALTSKSIGATIASKEIYLKSEKSTLLCLPIRSFSYNNEWTDNMFVGDGTSNDTRTITSSFDSKQYTFANKYQNHAGFCLSAMVVLNFLRQYIEKYNITGKIKLWIVGYSRGGAVANVAAALLDRAINEKNLKEYLGKNIKCEISHDDIYAYTMGTPQGAYANQNPSPRSAIYNNIFNLINPNDVVTQVPLRQWGFTRYGIDKYMTTKTIDPNYEINKKLWKKQMKNPSVVDKIDNFSIYKVNGDVNKEEFLNVTPQIAWHMLASGITEEIPSRKQYADQLQGHLQEVISKYVFGQKDKAHLIYAIFNGLFFTKLIDNARVDAMVISILRGGYEVISDIHSHDNYFSYAKANDLSYVSKNDQVQLFDEYTFYDVYTRAFDQVCMVDTNKNCYLFKNEPKPSSEKVNQPYGNQISSCVFDYAIYPYYIEAIIPAGYNIDFKINFNAIHVWANWDGFAKITTVSSNPNKNGKVIFYEEDGVNIFHSYHSGNGHLD